MKQNNKKRINNINTTNKIKPQIINHTAHKICISQLTKSAVAIINKLEKAGFSAYIVGGGVRDLILGYKPKDFDIATDARPEQIKNIFKNSRIIGRRFRLAHIYFNKEIIEVATFRASPNEKLNNHTDEHSTIDGQIIRDNIYGTIEDDIWRRDFTINALYYNPTENIILDYCNGYQDLINHQIKIIGDPNIRYREDPVRILRALRFTAKLDFNIHESALTPIKSTEFSDLLNNIPSARLYEEYNKFFLNGHAEKSFYVLKKYNYFNKLFPLTATKHINNEYPEHLGFIHNVLKNTDNRIINSLGVNPAFLLSVFLWHPMLLEHKNLKKNNNSYEYLWREAAYITIKKQNQVLNIPKRFVKIIEEIWYLQRLFNKKSIKAIKKAAYHPKFRAGFDFMILRSELETIEPNKLNFWKKYESSDYKTREQIINNYQYNEY